MKKIIYLIIIAALAASSAHAAHRSNKARHAFALGHACPSTGLNRLPCPGYVIDHIQPLCAGGADDPVNMQWQTIADAKAKDKLERKMCGAKAKEAQAD